MGLFAKAEESKTVEKPTTYQGATGITYVNGVNKTLMKKIAIFWFGPVVVRVMPDEKCQNLLVILSREPEDWQKIQFEKYWLVQVKVIK